MIMVLANEFITTLDCMYFTVRSSSDFRLNDYSKSLLNQVRSVFLSKFTTRVIEMQTGSLFINYAKQKHLGY